MSSNKLKFLVSSCENLNVLCVEDNYEVRLQTIKMLSIYFSSITEAIDGKDGLVKFKNSHFDIVFTDINMPLTDGISMIKEIRKIEPQIPVVVFSAYDNTEYFLETIKCGIEGYILKPFKFEEVQKVIEKIVLKLENSKRINTKIALTHDFFWDKENKSLLKDDKEIALTKKETLLFELLSSIDHKVATPEEIEMEIFNDDYSDNKRVRSLLSRLKCKIGCELIKNVYSRGYKLNLAKKC